MFIRFTEVVPTLVEFEVFDDPFKNKLLLV